MSDIYRLASSPPPPPPVRDAASLLRDFVAVCKRRAKLFFGIFGATVAVLAIVAFLVPKAYTTQARVIVGMGHQPSQGEAPTNLPILNALMAVSGIQSGETYAELMTESPVAQQVIEKLHLHATTAQLLSQVQVAPVNNTSIIQLDATWTTPQLSAAIANAFAYTFIDRERDLVAGQANTAIQFLSTEMPAAAERQRVTEAALSNFQQSHQIADVGSQTQATIAALTSLDVKAGQLQLDRRQASAQLSSASAQLAGMTPSAAGSQSLSPNPVAQQLETQLAQVETQLGTARKTYTERHPLVKSLEQQQAELREQIAAAPATVVSGTSTIPNPVYEALAQQAATFRAQIAADQAGLSELASQRKGLLAQIKLLPDETIEFAALERDAKQAEAVYAALQQRMSDAMIAKSTAISDVTITQEASAADAVAHPSRVAIVAIGALVGLILACSLIALLEYLDRRGLSEQEVRAAFGGHVLGSIPDIDTTDEASRVWLRALAMESLSQIVRGLDISGRRLNSIAFTSPHPGDGKTTVAINVAHALAELDGPVLLIDGDLRRPAIHKLLHLKNELGLSDILSGNTTLRQCIRATSMPGLDILTSGMPTPAPVQLLQRGDFTKILLEASDQHYRTVIVDLPAVLPVVDAALLADKVDGTVLVISAQNTGGQSAREAVAYLENIGVKNLLGLVINRARREPLDDVEYYVSNAGSPLALP